MKITVGSTTYTDIESIDFAPETDVTGSKVPINQFSADINTTDSIAVAQDAMLYDDSGKLWAKYWITDTQRHTKNVIRIIAQSAILLLDRRALGAVMYSSAPIATVISDIFTGTSVSYSLDSSFTDTISGYCPEQTARERLQWVCFTIGAYLKTFFTDKVEILPVSDTTTVIPASKTYYRPKVSYGDYVTAVKITAYTYTAGTPTATDKWVQVGGNYYIQTTQDFTIGNSDAPSTAEENVVEVKDVSLINSDNISAILSRLSNYYFNRDTFDADVIDEGEYIPGKRYTVQIDKSSLIGGFMQSAQFSFGHSAKASIKVRQTKIVDGVLLMIKYLYGETQLGSQRYLFPTGYAYSVENPYIDRLADGHRYVYYPVNDSATGTMGSSLTEDDEQYSVALDFAENILSIYNVDKISQSDEVITIK